jgi:hypothetical protein
VPNLRVPTGLPESDVDVVVTGRSIATHAKAWLDNFFDETYGAFADHPLERGSAAN